MALSLHIDLGSPTKEQVLALFEGLTMVNRLAMRQSAKRDWPDLRTAGVRYQRTGPWQAADVLLKHGRGDCKDLVPYEAARLREQGIKVGIRLTRTGRMWHVQIRLPDGRIFDPSKELGMRGDA